MTKNLIGMLQERLTGELPGKESQVLMAPSIRPAGSDTYDGSSPQHSGVMLLLFPDGEGLSTVFMLRSNGGPHGGQISLPGGKQEPGDATLIETAKRETFEEIGVEMSQVKVIGLLTPLYVPHSNYSILPVVGYLDHRPEFFPDCKEVAGIIVVSLAQLFDPANRKTMVLNHSTAAITAPYYDACDHPVWGATAMIISEFEQVLISCISG